MYNHLRNNDRRSCWIATSIPRCAIACAALVAITRAARPAASPIWPLAGEENPDPFLPDPGLPGGGVRFCWCASHCR